MAWRGLAWPLGEDHLPDFSQRLSLCPLGTSVQHPGAALREQVCATPIQVQRCRPPQTLATLVGEDAGVLESAAVLHDIGYAPPLVDTGFHRLDRARYLRDTHEADESVVRLVANPTYALLEAEVRGLRDELVKPLSPTYWALAA